MKRESKKRLKERLPSIQATKPKRLREWKRVRVIVENLRSMNLVHKSFRFIYTFTHIYTFSWSTTKYIYMYNVHFENFTVIYIKTPQPSLISVALYSFLYFKFTLVKTQKNAFFNFPNSIEDKLISQRFTFNKCRISHYACLFLILRNEKKTKFLCISNCQILNAHVYACDKI